MTSIRKKKKILKGVIQKHLAGKGKRKSDAKKEADRVWRHGLKA